MTTINNASQIALITDAYDDHAAEWNALDTDAKDGTKADGKWSETEIADFAKGFEDTPEGQKALESIIEMINSGYKGDKGDDEEDVKKGLMELIKGIRDGHVQDIDAEGNIYFTDEYTQSLLEPSQTAQTRSTSPQLSSVFGGVESTDPLMAGVMSGLPPASGEGQVLSVTKVDS